MDAASPGAGPVFGVLCRFTSIEDKEGGRQRLVGIVINLLARPVTVAVVRRGGATVLSAVELRSGAKVSLGQTGVLLRSGRVLVLKVAESNPSVHTHHGHGGAPYASSSAPGLD